MKDFKWVWISYFCLVIWIAILFWIDKALSVHAQEGNSEVSEEELEEEMYYDSLELLAVCVEAEAGNQGLDGKRMVVDVILNRVDAPGWPDTVEEVITQPYAFSSYWDGGMDRVWDTVEKGR